jgi:hypothetical protein
MFIENKGLIDAILTFLIIVERPHQPWALDFINFLQEAAKRVVT